MCQDLSIYEYRTLAFVDILGFRTMIQQSVCDFSKQKRILDAMRIIHSYKELNDTGFDGEGLRKYGVQVTTFSDSAIISYPIDFDGGLFHVLIDLIHLQIDLSNLGIFIRCGVSMGLAYHSYAASYDTNADRYCGSDEKVSAKVLECVDRRERVTERSSNESALS